MEDSCWSDNRTCSLFLTWLSVCFMVCCHTPDHLGGKKRTKQNIIFILADDLGWKDLTCYGSDFYETPNIDALARSGMLFTDAYTASPLCSPTRASILTGQEPGRLRFTTPTGHLPKVVLDPRENNVAPSHYKTATPDTKTRLPNEYLTFAEVMKEEGYATAFMGKWHLGREPYIPENQGFDVVVGGREHPGPPGPGHFFSPWNCETLPVVPEGTHISDAITDEAIAYIRQQKNNPFLLCLWYYDVHAPFQAKEDLMQKYQQKLTSGHLQRSPTMGAMIETMDINVGRVMRTIADMGLDEETIVIFTSDNGGNMYDGPDGTTPTNNHPLRAGKGNNYEGGVRVPLIVRVPGLTKAGSKSSVVTSSVDHYASILELLAIKPPKEFVTDGFSYVDALKEIEYERAPIYSTFCHNVIATGNRANISMRQGSWRFYKFFYDGPNREHRYELYNLDSDIGELKNLADEMPEKTQDMLALLNTHVEEAGILLPRKNEAYNGNVAAGWQGSKETQISVLNKVLNIKSMGRSPSVETVYTPNILDETYILKFEMKSDGHGEGLVSWQVAGDSTYIEENRSHFSGLHDNAWHDYQITMPLERRLHKIQIHPCQGKGNISLRNIKIVTQDNHYIRDWPLY